MAKTSTLPPKETLDSEDRITAYDSVSQKTKGIKGSAFRTAGIVFRETFYQDDLTFEQIDPGDLTLALEIDQTVFEGEPDMDVYHYDSRLTTEKIMKMKLVDDFEISKSPELGKVDFRINGGLSFVLSSTTSLELLSTLTIQKMGSGDTDFVDIKSTQSIHYIQYASFDEKDFSDLSSSISVEDASNLPFESGDMIRILLTLQFFGDNNAITGIIGLLNPIPITGVNINFINNIDSIDFLQHRAA